MNYHFIDQKLGAHVPWQKNILSTLEYAYKMRMSACQFFMGSPKSFKRNEISENDLRNSVTKVTHFPFGVFSHAPYLFNLCGSKACLAWEGDVIQDAKTQKVIDALSYELSIMAHFPISGVIVHPGNYDQREVGLAKIAETISRINFSPNSKLLLENAAGQGTSLATTIAELATIYNNVQPCKQQYIYFCIDTAHIHGFGEYDLRKCSEIDRLFSDFDKLLGLDKWKLLHLNDSCVPLGCRKDRHELIAQGNIWKEDQTALKYLVNKCCQHDIPIVLETTPEDVYNLYDLVKN